MNRLALIPALAALLASSLPTAIADELLMCGFYEVYAVSPATLAAGKVEKLWSWKAEGQKGLPAEMAPRFATTDECKPIHDGRQILIASSGGACALVDYPSGEVRWHAAAVNAHSIELLPGDRAIVASSTGGGGNRLVLFDLARSNVPIWQTPLESAHGVVWDEARRSLWALGFNELRRYSLVDWDRPTPSLKLEATFPLPNEGGHDLQAVPGSNDLVITTHDTASLFDRDRQAFRPHPSLQGREHVKAVAIHPKTGATYFVQGDSPEWWSRSIQSLDEPKKLPVGGERVYKIRWCLDPSPRARIKDADDLRGRIQGELHATSPDFVVFVPKVRANEVTDTGNEHFLVCDGPQNSLIAVWTQSSAEGDPDQHVAFAKSIDDGKTWTEPRIIAGPKKPGDGRMASWGYPLVSKSGRIYVLYGQNVGKVDQFAHHTAELTGIFSDDAGETWSKPRVVPVARSTRDNPDPTMPPNMLCWQKPLRLGEGGRYLAGFTRWTSFAVTPLPRNDWRTADARVEFMRFENVDDSPEPQDLKISWFARDDDALSVPFPGLPNISACQEPSIVKLPDGRLFVVMRTAAGSPYWSQSRDGGETWTKPRVLLRKDGGAPLLHPLSPCPIYDVGGEAAGSGRYALFLHSHDGHHRGIGPADTALHRRPIYLAAGRFRADADQPVWFDEPRLFMSGVEVALGKPGTPGRLDMSLYASSTVRNGRAVLWYPDRKFFLLGRVIGEEWFSQAP